MFEKNYSKSLHAYIRSKQNVRDKIGPLEDSAGNIISQGFLMAEAICICSCDSPDHVVLTNV